MLVGKTGRVLSVLDLFLILELDKEWNTFIGLRKQILLAVKSSHLKEFIETKINSIPELKVILMPILLDIGLSNKTKKVFSDILERVFRPSELFPVMSSVWFEQTTKLKTEIENFFKKNTVKFTDQDQLERLAAKIAGEDASKVSSDDLISLIYSSAQLMVKTDKFLQQEVKIRTCPVSFQDVVQGIDIYHELYPVKRLQNVTLKNLTDDLFFKLIQAQKANLTKIFYSCRDFNEPQIFIPMAIMSNLNQLHRNVDKNLLSRAGDMSLLVSLINNCMTSRAFMRSQMSVISQLYSQIIEDLPAHYIPGLRDKVSYGIKMHSKQNLRSLYLVIVNGAKVLDKKIIKLSGETSSGETIIDIDFESEFTDCLKKYFPRSIAIEVTTKAGITIMQEIKALVAKFMLKKSGLQPPIYITRKSPIPERRACNLDNRLKESTGGEFVHLIAYSMACQAQDRLLENFKLRIDTREFPYLYNESFVSCCYSEIA